MGVHVGLLPAFSTKVEIGQKLSLKPSATAKKPLAKGLSNSSPVLFGQDTHNQKTNTLKRLLHKLKTPFIKPVKAPSVLGEVKPMFGIPAQITEDFRVMQAQVCQGRFTEEGVAYTCNGNRLGYGDAWGNLFSTSQPGRAIGKVDNEGNIWIRHPYQAKAGKITASLPIKQMGAIAVIVALQPHHFTK